LKLDVNAKDHEGTTPLHLAAAISEISVWKLIQAGADIQARTIHGLTPLHFAAKAGRCNGVDLLVMHYQTKSLSLNGQDLKGRTALHEAARSGRPESVQILLAAGASFNIADKHGRTPLHASAEFEDVPVPRNAQQAREAKDPLVPEPRLYGPNLRCKTAFEKMEMIVSPENDPSCIREVVKLLLKYGVDPRQFDDNEHTATDVALMLRNSAVVEELAASMATVYSQGEDSLGTRLHPLDPFGELLIDVDRRSRNANIHIDYYGDPAQSLEWIISFGDDALLEYVVRTQKAAGLLVRQDLNSALHLIAECGLTSMMRRILPLVENAIDTLPPLLHAALDRPIWNVEMLNVLVQHGVDVNSQQANPKTADGCRLDVLLCTSSHLVNASGIRKHCRYF
jgi:ankyrin repeat protein